MKPNREPSSSRIEPPRSCLHVGDFLSFSLFLIILFWQAARLKASWPIVGPYKSVIPLLAAERRDPSLSRNFSKGRHRAGSKDKYLKRESAPDPEEISGWPISSVNRAQLNLYTYPVHKEGFVTNYLEQHRFQSWKNAWINFLSPKRERVRENFIFLLLLLPVAKILSDVNRSFKYLHIYIHFINPIIYFRSRNIHK